MLSADPGSGELEPFPKEEIQVPNVNLPESDNNEMASSFEMSHSPMLKQMKPGDNIRISDLLSTSSGAAAATLGGQTFSELEKTGESNI